MNCVTGYPDVYCSEMHTRVATTPLPYPADIAAYLNSTTLCINNALLEIEPNVTDFGTWSYESRMTPTTRNQVITHAVLGISRESG